TLVRKYGIVHALDVRGARERGVMPLPLGSGLQYERAAALALAGAEREAAALGSSAIGVRHLLLALLATEEAPLCRVLERVAPGIAERVRQRVRRSLPPTASAGRVDLPRTRSLQLVLKGVRVVCGDAGTVTEAALVEALLRQPGQLESVFRREG